MDFSLVQRAKLGPSDLAPLLMVNRVTISSWLNGHNSPHVLLTDRVARLLVELEHALDQGSLPVPYNVTRRERRLYIQQALEASRNAQLYEELRAEGAPQDLHD